MLHRDGSIRWFLSTGSAVRNERGEVSRVVGTAADISRRKQLEDERAALTEQMLHAEKLKSLGVLAGGVAHDFNNLLTAVQGNADLALAKLPESSSAREPIERVRAAAQQAAELTRQLLAYSGKGAFVREPVDLRTLLEQMQDLVQVSISKKANLCYTYGDGLPLVEGDAGQLRQVLMNLITNASEALGDGSGTIRITLDRLEVGEGDRAGTPGQSLSKGLYLFVEVSDDGCGMDETVRARIFDPFFTTKFTGRGLGLAAVQGIVNGHGGRVRVVSRQGVGTTVTLLLPAADREPEQAVNKPEVVEVDAVTGCVLVADDDRRIRTLARTVLEQAGFEVLEASDGQEALDVYRQRSREIDLVLLDLTMPRMNGQEALRELRLIREDARIILSSGYPESDAVGRGVELASVVFLQKPWGPAALMESVRSALRSS
jgi:signal transduction histidine kinase/CheY-like chemotaxis protein